MVVYDGFILQLTAMVVKDGSTFTTWLLVMVIFKFVKFLFSKINPSRFSEHLFMIYTCFKFVEIN